MFGGEIGPEQGRESLLCGTESLNVRALKPQLTCLCSTSACPSFSVAHVVSLSAPPFAAAPASAIAECVVRSGMPRSGSANDLSGKTNALKGATTASGPRARRLAARGPVSWDPHRLTTRCVGVVITTRPALNAVTCATFRLLYQIIVVRDIGAQFCTRSCSNKHTHSNKQGGT